MYTISFTQCVSVYTRAVLFFFTPREWCDRFRTDVLNARAESQTSGAAAPPIALVYQSTRSGLAATVGRSGGSRDRAYVGGRGEGLVLKRKTNND